MKVCTSPAEARRLRQPIVTIGNFDGLHLGHQRILAKVRARAAVTGGDSLALTFDPHPVRVLAPQREIRLLTPLPEKLRLFEAEGLSAVLVLPFTSAVAALAPEDFVRGILVDCLHAKEILVGGNFRFGHRQAGDVSLLIEMGRKLGFTVKVVAPVQRRGEVVSSSRIRAAIAEGNMGLATRLLGRPFAVQGPVGKGRGIGTSKTVPTLNLAPYAELLPLRGVYITETDCGQLRGPSVTNIGHNPTFGETDLHLESHLLNVPARNQAPGKIMRVTFHERIRDEVRFPSAEALRERIGRDIAAARRYFQRSKKRAAHG